MAFTAMDFTYLQENKEKALLTVIDFMCDTRSQHLRTEPLLVL